MKLYVAQGDCGDYYCDAEHLLGIFDTAEEAKSAVNKWTEADPFYDGTLTEWELNKFSPDYPFLPRNAKP